MKYDENKNFKVKSRSWEEFVPNRDVESIAFDITKDYCDEVKNRGLSKIELEMLTDYPSKMYTECVFNQTTKKYENKFICEYADGSKKLIPMSQDTRNYYIVDFGNGFKQNFHRVVYVVNKGDIPSGDYAIDHINGNHADNRIENLRIVTRKDNYLRPYISSSRFKKLFLETHTYEELNQLIRYLKEWSEKIY